MCEICKPLRVIYEKSMFLCMKIGGLYTDFEDYYTKYDIAYTNIANFMRNFYLSMRKIYCEEPDIGSVSFHSFLITKAIV